VPEGAWATKVRLGPQGFKMLRNALALKSASVARGHIGGLGATCGRYRMESGHQAGIAKASRMTQTGHGRVFNDPG
jgi:hypothetical protein